MASRQAVPSLDAEVHYKRTKSTFMSFIHKRTPSKGTVLPSSTDILDANSHTKTAPQVLPPDHPHGRPLSELQYNQHSQPPSSPKKSKNNNHPYMTDGEEKPLHKKSKSTISLRSLVGRDTDSRPKSKDASPGKPKKTKSSTNLASILSRPKSSKSMKKAAQEGPERDKENQSPTDLSPSGFDTRPPIYAQFSSQHFTTQPLGGKFLEDEIDLYTPRDYSPSKQRNFYSGADLQPTLNRSDGTKRPMSTFLPSSYSIRDMKRDVSTRRSADEPRRVSFEDGNSSHKNKKISETKTDMTMAKRGAKVMAAVAAIGTKAKVSGPAPETSIEIKDVDAEFEAMLDRRNIPENQRHKMRSLALSMKKDFIRQDWAETAAAQVTRSGSHGSNEDADNALGQFNNPKPKRPRSRTFTLSKSTKEPTSPTKKSRPESAIRGHSRSKSSDSTAGHGRSLSSTGAAVANNLLAKAKGQLPDDFVAYLRKVQKPQVVEVGKLHKLRLLLRNETVAWTDEFIDLGGMTEIVGLLYRTLEVEWREEHEDALLHEVLLCLKALCTTALALQSLNEIQSKLFPTLIHMLFDEEKKGPSEFTTRNIVTWLLFTYLKSAPLPERSHRSQVLLSYLRDPERKEDERPLGFVLDMRRERPYRVWNKEVLNVTKEVFWIFLHNLNVIALPSTERKGSNKSSNSEKEAEAGMLSISAAVKNSASFDAFNAHHVYMLKHFPQELPPVPAAPYVGGVEWDATNYLASHLDLMNGILCSSETREQRNELREQLRASGWEKCMGTALRTCKEKFYGGVHAGLRSWVAAAFEDGWDVRDVRCGPPTEPKSPAKKSPLKKKVEIVPKLEMPKFDFGIGKKEESDGVGWL